MTISIDLRMMHASGIGTYIRNLVPRIMQLFPDLRFNLLGRLDDMAPYPWAHTGQVTRIACEAPIYSVAEQVDLARQIPADTRLFWSPHYNIPLLYRGKLLVTVHDVFHLAMPEYVGGLHKRLYARWMFSVLRKRADAIVCDSRFTQGELERLSGPVRGHVQAVHLGVEPVWFEIRKSASPYPKPYIIYVGNVKPHKNLRGLLNAFLQVQDVLPHDLVIVGKKEGFITGDTDIGQLASGLGERCHFTGFVEESLLHQYVVHADMLVLPSLYEGFGLPPLEAMACGCPVIVSRCGSLPEICGDAAVYCDARNPGDIAEKIRWLAGDPEAQQNLRQKGMAHAARFSWEHCAQETASVIRNILSCP